MTDRDYDYLATTLHSDSLDRAGVTARLAETLLPVWRRLADEGLIRNARCLTAVGEVPMKVDPGPVRRWDYQVMIELAESADPSYIAEREWRDGELSDDPDLEVLARDLLRRPAESGVAVPRPGLPALPSTFRYGIEYIDIPADRWQDYREFMRDLFGPVGARMVALGQAYQVIITERIASLHRDPSLPPWNRLHVLVSDFDHEPGFFDAATAAVRAIKGADEDVFQALSAADDYRRKPRMSKNVIIEELSVGPD